MGRSPATLDQPKIEVDPAKKPGAHGLRDLDLIFNLVTRYQIKFLHLVTRYRIMRISNTPTENAPMSRIEGLQELIELLDESIEKATRIKVAYFDESLEKGRNEGLHAVQDLESLKRLLGQELADELAEREDA